MLDLVWSAAAVCSALLYLRIYKITRKIAVDASVRHYSWKIALCFIWNSALLFLPGKRSPLDRIPLLILFLILADTDIFIQKIPTELLILSGTVSFLCGDHVPDPLPVVTAVSAALVFLIIDPKKTGIARYDIVLTAILAMHCTDILQQIRFVSVLMILWGSVGLILRYVRKGSASMKIPLSPVILTAYAVLSIPFRL